MSRLIGSSLVGDVYLVNMYWSFVVVSIKSVYTELGSINPDVPFVPANTEHQYPLSRLGNEKKNVEGIMSCSVPW